MPPGEHLLPQRPLQRRAGMKLLHALSVDCILQCRGLPVVTLNACDVNKLLSALHCAA